MTRSIRLLPHGTIALLVCLVLISSFGLLGPPLTGQPDRAQPMQMSPVVPPGPRPLVSAAACVDTPLREGARGTTQTDHTIDGQAGVAQVPSGVPGASYGRPAAADVYVLEPSTGEFFQGGWYLGGFPGNSSSNGLPATSTPRAWFGEWTSAGHERLSSPVAVSPGQHTFSVRLGSDGRAYGFVDGVQRWISTQTHFAPYVPGVTGESNNTCTGMNSKWFAQAGSIAATKTLQLHRFGQTYAYWVQHLSINQSSGLFRDGRFGGVSATDCANPTGDCQYRT